MAKSHHSPRPWTGGLPEVSGDTNDGQEDAETEMGSGS